ncbi:carboxymuconolactone decarboxylase family protein [Falsirhodobacter deserti]|uniref:carboxymuconolactone decarboxylase family protein n=1 Tax=Falsirhodobacter deserti TaxID=1365611 RepID=UPI000FE2C9A7|nr:carboxymuconolactone decarboxylase family protein [Falsirhodobacter deserti]
MTPRMNYYKAAPDTMKAMRAAEETAKDLSLPDALRELVKMRVSQINGCAFCLDMHAPVARQAGVSQQKLDVLAAWRESPVFDDRERAALAWAEALTRIEQTGAPDSDYQRLAVSFDERERVELTFVITLINAWNRFAVGFRTSHALRKSQDAAV